MTVILSTSILHLAVLLALKLYPTFAFASLVKFELLNSKILPNKLLLLVVPGKIIVLLNAVVLLSIFFKSETE